MSNEEHILQLVSEKGITAIEVFNKSKTVFESIKSILQAIEQQLKEKITAIDARIPVEYDDRGRLEVHFKVANDVLVFMMHTAVFNFEYAHFITKTSYVKENPLRSFCGMICVYNFLADSIRFSRINDTGALVARLFVNKENHFFVEGKKQVGILFNDFENETVDESKLKKFIEILLIHVLELDVNVSPFESMQHITLQQLLENSSQAGFSTGKRFGFVLPGVSDDV
ncbi:MAG: hypothetical protein ACHQNT_08210 [Bacteroidia bacterium]